MIKRTIFSALLDDLDYFPIVGIIGARQVGKTTLAKSLLTHLSKPGLYLDLESENDLRKLEDAEFYLSQYENHCVILDEIQLKPSLFPLLRALVDKNRRAGRFIILGSASPILLQQSAESLAGRIAYHELPPFSLPEVSPQIALEKHWFWGGFPEAVLAPAPRFSAKWLQQFMATFIERDLAAIGFDGNAVLFRRLLQMLAHINTQLLNTSELARSLGVSTTTVNRYLAYLEGGFVLHRLQPYHVNLGKRLVKSPKIYLSDTGIYHQLLGIHDFEGLYNHPAIGASWEAYVVAELRKALPNTDLFFYRTAAGAEVDVFFTLANGNRVCIEIKNSNSPSLSRGFHEGFKDLDGNVAYILVPNADKYLKSDKVWVCGLHAFLMEELPRLLPPIR
jgi:uncharacterized protein